MALFRFGRKLESTQEFSLEEVPLFSTLTPSELKIIQKQARRLEYKRGDIVYRQGEPSDALYVVMSGRFRLFEKSRDKEEGETLFYLYRGDHFAEASLLTGHVHSVTVEAKRDGVLLKLDRDDFLKFVRDFPALSQHLNRSLGHRLTRREDTNAPRREVKIAAYYDLVRSEDSVLFWLDFASRLHRETGRQVIVVDLCTEIPDAVRQEFKNDNLPSLDLTKYDPASDQFVRSHIYQHASGVHYLHVPAKFVAEAGEKKLSALMTYLTYSYDFLMIRLLRDLTHVTAQALTRSDLAYVFCPSDSERLPECAEVIDELQQRFGFSKSEIRIIAPQENSQRNAALEEKSRLLGVSIFSYLPSRHDRNERYHGSVRFLSRELAGKLIGLALGSGAAYGLSHIGVIRVLEQENISVDVVSGSSIGSLIGAFWAAGFSADELEGIAKSINRANAFFKLVGFRDLSLAHRGFIKGNQVVRFLHSFLGDMTFQDLRFPLKIIATNLFNSEEVVFETGRVVDALRASISIPGIFRPFHYRDEYLIDGGVIDPLPVGVLNRMGVRKIIAVNVLSSPRDRLMKARRNDKARRADLQQASDSGPAKGLKDSLQRMNRHYSVNVFNVIMNTIQFMEYELALISGTEADVLIHPEVESAHWAQFYSSRKFIKAGEDAVREHLDEIKQLIAE
jgi:NTE family protein